MSDHCDWQGLNEAVLATGAENIYVTHGYRSVYAKWLRENYKLNAVELETQFEGESIESSSLEASKEESEDWSATRKECKLGRTRWITWSIR